MRKYKCSICGYVYDEATGASEQGIAPGTKWEDIPDDYTCPVCTAPKAVFQRMEAAPVTEAAPAPMAGGHRTESLRALSAGEISAICSNLAKGCEKQRLLDEMEALNQLARYFMAKAAPETGRTLEDAAALLRTDMAQGFPAANAAAKASTDRGALRSLVWSEKVSAMMQSLLARYAKEGDAMLEHTSIYVCDICGFLMIGDAPPEICPVCKVPNYKIVKVERR